MGEKLSLSVCVSYGSRFSMMRSWAPGETGRLSGASTSVCFMGCVSLAWWRRKNRGRRVKTGGDVHKKRATTRTGSAFVTDPHRTRSSRGIHGGPAPCT